MAKIQLEPFQNVSAAGTALMTTTRIWPNTLEYVVITLGGGTPPTKAQISRILVRLGSKPIWDVTGSEIASICAYENRTATATILILPFSNFDARNVSEQFLGAIDFGAVGVRDMTFEVTLAGGVTPTLTALAEVAPPKVLDAASNVLFRALLRNPIAPSAAATFLPLLLNYGQAGGALLRRLWFFSALVTALEIKRDGLDIYEQIPLATNNAILLELQSLPQANIFTLDFIEDRIESKALTTIRKDAKGNVSLIPQQVLASLSAGGAFDVVADALANLNGL
jgi:Viral coat protein P2 N-terminal domain